MLPTDRQVAEILDLIRHAGFDVSVWPVLLAQICGLFDGARTSVQGYDLRTQDVFALEHGYDPDLARDYRAYYHAKNPWIGAIAQMPVARASEPERYLPLDQLVRTEFYAEWLRPQEEIATGAALVVGRDAGRFVALCVNLRLRDRERLQPALLKTLDRFSPHLVQAMNVRRAVRWARARGTLDAFEASDPRALLLVLDREGRILEANATADEALSRGVLSRSSRGHLRTGDAVADEAIDRRLLEGARLAAGHAPIPIRRSDSPLPLVVTVHRLPGSLGDPFAATGGGGWPEAVVVVHDPLDKVASDGTIATAVFRLTPSERRVAELICDGLAPAAVAARLGVTTATVRNQLASIFRKTGTSRQAELVTLFARLQ